jgi:hypothetical protein
MAKTKEMVEEKEKKAVGKVTPCPGCGQGVDYESVPSYSAKRERAGKFCPHCGFPLDEETAKKDTLEYGAGSEEAMASRVERASAFHKASAAK